MVHSSHLPGVQLYGKSAQLPSFDNSPVRVDHLGGYVNVKGKTKRTRYGLGKRSDWKKAYVRLAQGQEIDFASAE